jgi:transcriptional regulator with XRE-family HTH domain
MPPVVTPDLATASWIKTTRQSLGLSLQAIASRLGVSPQAVHQFESSEAAGSISLRQLQKVAEAMGFQLIYSLVARTGAVRPAKPLARTARKTISDRATAKAPRAKRSAKPVRPIPAAPAEIPKVEGASEPSLVCFDVTCD